MVNEQDEAIGLSEKLEAPRSGDLHRAISVFVFNTKGELLLQKRAAGKYHGGGLWSNTCCSHPRPDESSIDCAHRRLKEEMGFDCPLEERFSLIYRADVGNGLTEHEYDHVFFGVHDGNIRPDPSEVEDHTFVATDKLIRDAENHPDRHTVWFRIIMEKFRDRLTVMDQRLRSLGVECE